jgi:hypothetical protein
MPAHQGQQVPGPGHKAPSRPAILGVKGDHGESEMKVTDVLVKVYEPGRLQMAWQQVRKNAGAAGVDRMTVAEFAQREEPLLALIHDKLESGSYRFQPARRVLIPNQGTYMDTPQESTLYCHNSHFLVLEFTAEKKRSLTYIRLPVDTFNVPSPDEI